MSKQKIAKIKLTVFAVLMTVFGWVLLSGNAQGATVTVNTDQKEQPIRGFGGMTHPVWIKDLTASQRETAFGNGKNQLGLSVLRIHVDEDRNNWYKEVPTARAAVKNHAIVFATAWNAPLSMTQIYHKQGTKEGVPSRRVNPASYGEYTAYLNDFINYMKEKGVPLYGLSFSNEPDYASQWTWWTNQELLNYIENYADDLQTKVISPESFQFKKSFYNDILNSPAAMKNIDIFGTHTYGTKVEDLQYPLFKQKGQNKEFWMTEVYYPNSHANSANNWPESIDVAYNINNAMTLGNFNEYTWWYIRRNYGLMTDDGVISKRGYAMAHFSKFIRPGAYRVSATNNYAENNYSSSYVDGNKLITILINKSNKSIDTNVTLKSGKIENAQYWLTDASHNLQSEDSNIENNGSLTVTVPSQGIVTVTGQIEK